MDSEPDRELEVIRAQTHQTREKLATKLEALESQISQTVAGVTEAVDTVTQSVTGVTTAVESVTEKVTETVANVTETVSGTVNSLTESVSGTVNTLTESVSGTMQSVADTLDVSAKVQSAPWTAVGCAVAAGFAGGYLTGGHTHTNGASGANGGRGSAPYGSQGYTPQTYAPSSPTEPGPISHVSEAVADIGGAVRSLGISALMGVVSKLAQSAVPDALRADVCGALDKLKTRLGGRHEVPAELFDSKTPNPR